MTSPDSNTWLLLLFNLIGWVIMWFRKSGVKSWQHEKMWRAYEKLHGINGNGKKVTDG